MLFAVLIAPVRPGEPNEIPARFRMRYSLYLVRWFESGTNCTQSIVGQFLESDFTAQNIQQTNKQTPWSESASELYRPSDRRLSEK
jgi:hypothetical protein